MNKCGAVPLPPGPAVRREKKSRRSVSGQRRSNVRLKAVRRAARSVYNSGINLMRETVDLGMCDIHAPHVFAQSTGHHLQKIIRRNLCAVNRVMVFCVRMTERQPCEIWWDFLPCRSLKALAGCCPSLLASIINWHTHTVQQIVYTEELKIVGSIEHFRIENIYSRGSRCPLRRACLNRWREPPYGAGQHRYGWRQRFFYLDVA